MKRDRLGSEECGARENIVKLGRVARRERYQDLQAGRSAVQLISIRILESPDKHFSVSGTIL